MCHLAVTPAAVGLYSVVRFLRTQLQRAPYLRYGGVGSSPTVRSRIGTGVLSSPGLPSSCPYSPNYVEKPYRAVWPIANERAVYNVKEHRNHNGNQNG